MSGREKTCAGRRRAARIREKAPRTIVRAIAGYGVRPTNFASPHEWLQSRQRSYIHNNPTDCEQIEVAAETGLLYPDRKFGTLKQNFCLNGLLDAVYFP